MSKVKNGDTVSVHYVGTFEDGTEFDSSHSRNDPLSFEVGAGNMIPGFESAVGGMTVGETKSISLSPDDAYGDINPVAVQEIPRGNFAPDFEFQVDATIYGHDDSGQPMMAKIVSLNEDTVKLDFNHPLAGKNLKFEIELIEIL